VGGKRWGACIPARCVCMSAAGNKVLWKQSARGDLLESFFLSFHPYSPTSRRPAAPCLCISLATFHMTRSPLRPVTVSCCHGPSGYPSAFRIICVGISTHLFAFLCSLPPLGWPWLDLCTWATQTSLSLHPHLRTSRPCSSLCSR